jgi:formylglycine-generating enzyme required for sulfatase activity
VHLFVPNNYPTLSGLIMAMMLSAPAAQGASVSEFQDCEDCPVMITIPAGRYLMGTAISDRLIDPRTGKPATNDSPQHEVRIETPFAIGKYEVTVADYRNFISETGHESVDRCMEFSKPNSFTISKNTNWDNPGFKQDENAPVGCVSFFDAQAYASWLTAQTGETYRLPSEAEWEYAARAGSTAGYHWGADETQACEYANVRSAGAFTISKRQAESDIADGFPCDDGVAQSSAAGSFKPNDFGLHDMQGNNWEWVADCNHKDYDGAPTDGSNWLDEVKCQFGVIRGGSYLNRIERSSATVRAGRPQTGGAANMGFRVARGTTVTVVPSDVQNPDIDQSATQDDGSAGARLFNDNCAACHIERTAYTGIYGKDQKELETTIRDGGNNIMSMPAFDGELSNEEIAELAAYVRKVNGWE